MQTTTTNADDREYQRYIASISDRILAMRPARLFTTDAEGLWEAYLGAFEDEASKQHHNCRACRSFIERYGGLVVIDPADGSAEPAMWLESPTEELLPAVVAMKKIVRRARVTGVFLSADRALGTPVTPASAKYPEGWRHLSAVLPELLLHQSRVQSPDQAMAEKRQDFAQVSRALSEYKLELLDQALALLESDALYRAEKVIGPARWLRDLASRIEGAKGERRKNRIWHAIASAPAGFCHPRSSMVGTLLDDLAAGKSMEDAARAFKAKMNPLQYQRPQTPPSSQTIEQAEKLVAQLGIERSLVRRFALLSEVPLLWSPSPTNLLDPPKPNGVFDVLKNPSPSTQRGTLPVVVMTWEKFQRQVLPEAKAMTVRLPYARLPFGSFTTAVHTDAPPILQWDSEERRNPLAWYVYVGGSTPTQWSYKEAPIVVPVLGVANQPNSTEHHGTGVLFALHGCADTRNTASSLFPETMRSELHGVRSVIEAYSRRTPLTTIEGQHAAGLLFQRSLERWPELLFTVDMGTGPLKQVRLDRWD